MRVRPSTAMTDSPKSRASGPSDMTAQSYVSLDSLARTRLHKRHLPANFRGRKTRETCQKSGGFHQQRALRRELPAPCTWRPRAACKHKARSTAPRLSDGSPFFPRSLPELMKTTRFLAGPSSKLCTQQKGSSQNESTPASRTPPRRCETSVRS